jgi:hypothetical protein
MSLEHKSVPGKVIKTFATLLKAEPYLFAEQDITSLWQLIPNLPDNVNAIAQELISWCQQRPEIFETLEDELGSRGVAESIPVAKPEDYKTLLKNKMRESFPETEQKQSDSKK